MPAGTNYSGPSLKRHIVRKRGIQCGQNKPASHSFLQESDESDTDRSNRSIPDEVNFQSDTSSVESVRYFDNDSENSSD